VPPAPIASPEGELVVALHCHAGQVADCTIASSRPDVAARLLQGRAAEAIAAAVPRLFSLCSDSQGVACQLALAAARSRLPDPAHLADVDRRVAAEVMREAGLRVMLGWPRVLGEVPDSAAVAAARRLRDPGKLIDAPDDAMAQALFAEPVAAWLGRDHAASWWAWADAGACATARFVAWRRSATPRGEPAPRLLPSPAEPGLLRELAGNAFAVPGFSAAPTWQGLPAETGALAWARTDPLVQDLLRLGQVAAARQAARLRELARQLLAPDPSPRAGALALAPGLGLGWAHNARGLLIHVVELDGERALRYRIVAPTEWNFHPQGALAEALRGIPAADSDSARSAALELVDSLDPCVACRVEVIHDA
jgi:hypothetical protein